MKVLLCDFVGHAFPTELSRALADRGHQVHHVHLAGFVVGKGPLERQASDPSTLQFTAVDLGAEFPKYQPAKRLVHEVCFAWRLLAKIRRDPPDVLVLSTTPPITQLMLVGFARALRIPPVVWLQDLFGLAIASGGEAAVGKLARPITVAVSLIERLSIRSASHVVSISCSFVPHVEKAGVPPSRISVVPNWAALTKLKPGPKRNPWSTQHDLDEVEVVLYAGTLGYKHDWTLLRDLARALASRKGAKLVVVSEGVFVERLSSVVEEEDLDSVVVLPFQAFDDLPDVLASADVCLALLTEDAAQYSVPSKVQSYLAAGRPVLIAGSTSGDAARAIVAAGAGLAVDANDREGLVDAAFSLLDSSDDRGQKARRFAEAEFEVDAKADQFEAILSTLERRRWRRSRR